MLTQKNKIDLVKQKKNSKTKLDKIEEAVADFKKGKVIIVVDDEDRENEGDMIYSAQKSTPELVNFLAKHGRGLVCVPMEDERLNKLELGMMTTNNTALHETAFTVSVDYVHGTTTGISASDRNKTILSLLNNKTKPADLGRPGHIFPLRSAPGGVLRRAGHTEAAVDLAKLAGHYPAGVLCEVLKENGEMARLTDLYEIAERFGLKIISIQDLIQFRLQREILIQRLVDASLPSEFGNFKIVLYKSKVDNKEHVALVKGTIDSTKPVLVRVHSECLTGDVFGSLRCDCREQLLESLRIIERSKSGILLYMRQEGRGIGLHNKLRAYKLQEKGRDTVEANLELGFSPDLRDYGIGAQILRELGVRKMRLLTNNPKKVVGLNAYGLEIVERVPIEIEPNSINRRYLTAKRDKLGHMIMSGGNLVSDSLKKRSNKKNTLKK
ncbi:MAG: bifunctional 3,4-dihydroxy-2-butanone-4-phosphate synthase/GTP cyclohydrolase II [Ignavibacteria bacterium]|nr:bifunctional 3,4-dihydroxy-2-butanone-4-phosphate synthase/GTP cyclohydrolase II [Ignavibacteria bacterium]